MPVPDNTYSPFGGVDAIDVEGSSATILPAWHGRFVRFADGCVVTIPPGLPERFSCGWSQDGAEPITFVAGSGVTLQSHGDALESAGQYALGGLGMMEQDIVRLYGALA